MKQLNRWLCLAGICLLTQHELAAEDWPRFRGVQGQGIALSECRTEWSRDAGVAWKVDLPGKGASSPIVVGNRLFVTCYQGVSGDDARRTVVCYDAESGKQLWEQSIPAPPREDDYSGYLREHGYASATPVSDGKRVFAFFGKAGVVAYTVDGERLWQHDVGQMSSNRRWGSAASPVLFQNILIVNASEESRAVYGLNADNGEELWKSEYDGLELCYATPVLAKGEGDVMEAILPMAGEVWGLNPQNGKLRWYCVTETPGNVCPSAVLSQEAVFTFGGFPQQQTNAIKRGGRRDITETHRLWQSRDSSYVPTPVYHDGHLYWVTDRGMAFCMNAANGETVTRNRLSGLASGGRPVYASPIKSGKYLYVVTRRSGTLIFEAAPQMKQVAHNEALDDSDFNATPAVSDGRLYLRSDKALYCIR